MNKLNILQIIKHNNKELKKLLLWGLILIVIDQFFKLAAQKYLENSKDIVLIPNLLSLHFLRNEIIHLYQYVIYFVLAVIALPRIIIQMVDRAYNKLITVGLTLLWSAVFSNNLVDVFLLGYIRDLINLHGVAVGNIADQYRTVGLLLVIAGLIIREKEKLQSKTLIIITVSLLAALALFIIFWRYFAKSLAI
jgi:lipoprotein signal peptidase